MHKIVLAYSGGLDTSVMIPWLKENYKNSAIIAVTCDVGQSEDLESIRKKALKSGADEAYLLNVQEEFVQDFLWPLLKCNALYEDQYILGTISRPLIAKKLVEIAQMEKADAIAHGATGKGNDQVRFEYSIKALQPSLKIIAPWRTWEIKSRNQAIEYAAFHGIDIPVTPKAPFSRDQNLWYTSHEGGVLEDPAGQRPDDLLLMTQSLKASKDQPENITITFLEGIPIALNDKHVSGVECIKILNQIAGAHGIGVEDIIENRLVGMKIRGIYEAPAATVLYKAHKMLESLCLDKHLLHLKQSLQADYANLVYEGRWFSPAKKALDALMNESQKYVTGTVQLQLYKGNIIPCGMHSPFSLHQPDLATFEEDTVYNQQDAQGFINLFSLSNQVHSMVHAGEYHD